MGQLQTAPAVPSLILTATDRLVAANADGGLSAAASHVVLLGESAGRNLGPLSYVYIIGASSLAGGLTTVNQNGSVVYGGLILSALTNATAPVQADGPFVAIGYNIAPALVSRVGQSQFIGDNILANYPAAGLEQSANILIGTGIFENSKILQANYGAGVGSFNVIMGYHAARGAAGVTAGSGNAYTSNVIIGAESADLGGFDGPVPGNTVFANVFIGRQVARQAGLLQNQAVQSNVFIGNQCCTSYRDGLQNVVIGSGASLVATGADSNVLVGANISGSANNNAIGNIAIGANAVLNNLVNGNILIGYNVNTGQTLAGSNKLLIESNTGATTRTLLYGVISAVSPSGLVVGHSDATNQDVPGFNILKVINGTVTGIAPAGGGFFYSKAGVIHWIDTANVDYDLTRSGSLGDFTVALLPAAPPKGSRAFATNALAPAFAAAVAGAGAIYTPVYFDGVIWRCG